ncbi:MAG: hypothetical protein V1857_03935 [archaeon]
MNWRRVASQFMIWFVAALVIRFIINMMTRLPYDTTVPFPTMEPEILPYLTLPGFILAAAAIVYLSTRRRKQTE